MKQPAGFIKVLLDRKADFGDRDDAAMDLCDFNEPEAEAALAKIATAQDTDDDLADSCTESLAVIWCRKRTVDVITLNSLQDHHRELAIEIIKRRNPDLLKKIL